MATIYIGSDFNDLRLLEKGGFAFTDEPYVVLFYKQSKKYFAADDLQEITGGYDVNFTADVTSRMVPGTYTLEVYTDNTMQNMLYRKEAYATAVIVAASPEQQDGSSDSNS